MVTFWFSPRGDYVFTKCGDVSLSEGPNPAAKLIGRFRTQRPDPRFGIFQEAGVVALISEETGAPRVGHRCLLHLRDARFEPSGPGRPAAPRRSQNPVRRPGPRCSAEEGRRHAGCHNRVGAWRLSAEDPPPSSSASCAESGISNCTICESPIPDDGRPCPFCTADPGTEGAMRIGSLAGVTEAQTDRRSSESNFSVSSLFFSGPLPPCFSLPCRRAGGSRRHTLRLERALLGILLFRVFAPPALKLKVALTVLLGAS